MDQIFKFLDLSDMLSRWQLQRAVHGKIKRPGGGDRGSGTPLKNHKNIGFLSNIGPDPL